MVWAAFSSVEKTRLMFANTNINAVAYTAILEQHLLPFVEDHPFDCTFQQDNASAHSAHPWRMESTCWRGTQGALT